MRMWMVDPRVLCDAHLTEEHRDVHLVAHALADGKTLDGHAAGEIIEPKSVEARHAALVAEMDRRGLDYEEKDGLPKMPGPKARPQDQVDPRRSLAVLWARCDDCRVRRGEALADRLEGAWFESHPEVTSTYGSRRWLAELARVTPQTLDKYIRGVHPPDRAEATLDLLER